MMVSVLVMVIGKVIVGVMVAMMVSVTMAVMMTAATTATTNGNDKGEVEQSEHDSGRNLPLPSAATPDPVLDPTVSDLHLFKSSR